MGTADQVATEIANLPEVSYLVMTVGSRDLIVEVFCRDLAHLTELSAERIQKIPGVRSTETLVIDPDADPQGYSATSQELIALETQRRELRSQE